MAKYLGILVSPSGEEFYDAYGPMTKLRDQATRFASDIVAAKAANHRFGRHSDAFWNSERTSRGRAAREYQGWTHRSEEVTDDDLKRNGHYIVSYQVGQEEQLYARTGDAGNLEWNTEMEGCELWADRNAAVAIIQGLQRSEGQRFAVASY